MAACERKGTHMLLQDKVSVIYGAGGAIGGAVARAFAREGAKVFLTGRVQEPVKALAQEVTSAGGFAEAAMVDALDENAIDKHLQSVVNEAGRVDISFNAIGIRGPEILGVPLAEIDAAQFALPLTTFPLSYFLTARLAARRMIPNKSGVIMTLSAFPARMGTTLNGGYGPAQAAKEALTRDLSVEFAPQGIRVVALRPNGLPETRMMRDLFELKPSMGSSFEEFTGFLATFNHARRVMTLDEVSNMAAFVASDKASGMTGTTVNMTMGTLDD